MSRRHRKATIQRAAMPMTAPTSGNVVTIPSSVWQAMMNSFAPQKNAAQTFSPGAPLMPIPGITPASGPRVFSVPPGFNLAGNDRTLYRDYIPAFEQLRLLAQTYSGIGMAERIWCDLIPRMTLRVTIRPDLKAAGDDDKNHQKEISGYRAFFEKPDGIDDIHTWLRKLIVEQTQIDALYLFKRRNRGGMLQGLDPIDGSIMKPLLDERGRIPVPPYAAYQQYAYGTPGQGYTTDEMIYYRESPRTFTPYGFSRVERIILLVNQALRKQKKDLARFTEGNLPEGMMEVPDSLNWSPDQIDAFEQMWNSLLAGNVQQQVRVKFTQPGMKYTQFDQFESKEHLTEFDRFLLNVTLGSYGLSMGDAGFTEDIHKSADEGQENMLYRRTIDPLAVAYGHILTGVLRDDFHDDRFVVEFGGYDEDEDLQTQANAFSILIQNAMISPSDAAAKLGLPDIPKTGPLFMTANGPIPLANFEIGSPMRTASEEAQLAGYDMTTSQATAPEAGTEETPPSSGTGKPLSDLEQRMTDIAEETLRLTLMLEDEEDTLSDLEYIERDWAAWDAAHPYQKKGRHPKMTPEQKAAAKKRKAELEAQMDQVQAENKQDKAEAKATKAEAKEDKAEASAVAKEQKQAAAAQKKQSALQAKAAKAATAAQAKAAKALATAQKQQAAASAKAAKQASAAQKKQAAASLKAAKKLSTLTKTLSSKASLYASLANRPISKSWTAQDRADAKAIADDLTSLLSGIGSHSGDASAVMQHLADSINLLHQQSPGTMSHARVQALQALSAQITRSVMIDEDDDYDDEWAQPEEEDAADAGDEYSPDGTREARTPTQPLSEPGQEEKRYTISELLALLQQQEQEADRAQGEAQSTPTGRELAVELNCWRDRAIDDMKRGRAFRGFTTTIIPESLYSRVYERLQDCTTVADVREVFRQAKQPDDFGTWQQSDPAILQRIADLRDQGYTHLTWLTDFEPCEHCTRNQDQEVELGKPFRNGALIQPAHEHCKCETVALRKVEVAQGV